MSLYPEEGNRRTGDPIADTYYSSILNDIIVCAICDGIGWGGKPRKAARYERHILIFTRLASIAFVEYVKAQLFNLKSTNELGQLLLWGAKAANLICYIESEYSAGTTLLGGALIPLEKSVGLKSHVFVSLLVGDCSIWKKDAVTGIVSRELFG
jgi:hypothetical protein